MDKQDEPRIKALEQDIKALFKAVRSLEKIVHREVPRSLGNEIKEGFESLAKSREDLT